MKCSILEKRVLKIYYFYCKLIAPMSKDSKQFSWLVMLGVILLLFLAQIYNILTRNQLYECPLLGLTFNIVCMDMAL